MNLPIFKSVISLVIFACGLASVVAPMFLVDAGSDSVLSIGNMMASGVLLAAGLTHQLADASSTLDDGGDGYPWSMLIAGCAFILFLILEESVHLMLSGGHEHNHFDATEGAHDHVHDHVHSQDHGSISIHPKHGGGEVIHQRASSLGTENQGVSLIGRRSCRGSLSLEIDHSGHSSSWFAGESSARKSQELEHTVEEDQPLVGEIRLRKSIGEDVRSSILLRTLYESVESMRDVHEGRGHGDSERDGAIHDHHHHHHEDHLLQHLHGSILASLVLLLALSLHSILAGLSMGIVSSTSAITSTAVAIIAHKVFAGYALGSTMASAEMERSRHILLGLIFALSTPIGIFLGIGLKFLAGGSYHDDSTAVGVVKAIVAGTFLYVAIVEVGMKELLVCRHDEGGMGDIDAAVKRTEVLKLAAFLGGFLAMSGLAAYL